MSIADVTRNLGRNALVKIAGQRARELARAAAARGDMGLADRIMRAPGVVPASSSGVPIKDLGAGSEGLAQIAYHPGINNGQAMVKKTFDPKGSLYSPEMAARKAQLAPELNQNPVFAKQYAAGATPRGVPIHYNELIQGREPSRHDLDVSGAKARASAHGAQLGLDMQDVRAGNMMRDQSGNLKVIDYMPLKKDEVMANRPAYLQENVVTPNDKGMAMFPNANNPLAKRSPGQILAEAYNQPKPLKPIPLVKPAVAPAAQSPAPSPNLAPSVVQRPKRGNGVPKPQAAPAPARSEMAAPAPITPTPAAPPRPSTPSPAAPAPINMPAARGWGLGHAAMGLGAAGAAYGAYRLWQGHQAAQQGQQKAAGLKLPGL